jgi:hypothetical protein
VDRFATYSHCCQVPVENKVDRFATYSHCCRVPVENKVDRFATYSHCCRVPVENKVDRFATYSHCCQVPAGPEAQSSLKKRAVGKSLGRKEFTPSLPLPVVSSLIPGDGNCKIVFCKKLLALFFHFFLEFKENLGRICGFGHFLSLKIS